MCVVYQSTLSAVSEFTADRVFVQEPLVQTVVGGGSEKSCAHGSEFSECGIDSSLGSQWEWVQDDAHLWHHTS